MFPSLTNQSRIVFGAFFALTVITLSLVLNTFLNFRAHSNWVVHTYEVEHTLSSLLSSLKDAETGQRGFLITADDAYLEPYRMAIANIEKQVQRLKTITRDNRSQQNRVPLLEAKIDIKIAELNKTIEIRQNNGFQAAQKIVLTHQGKEEMDDIRTIVQTMLEEEMRLLRNRSESEILSLRAFYCLAGLLLACLFLLVYLNKRYMDLKRESDREKLELANELKGSRRRLKEMKKLVPICNHCKSMFPERGLWQRLDTYHNGEQDVRFIHAVCPTCRDKNLTGKPDPG